MKSVNLRNLLIQMLLLTSLGLSAQTCPMVFNPVVGTNGVTYLNSCFAEAGGQTFITKGVSFSGCVNPQLMNPAATCGTTYDPVVGCNGEVYLNACEAQKHGVTSYMPQGAYAMNNGDIDNCFDYQNISNAFPTAFNYSNGTLNINCPVAQEPVCGCNGVTYVNPCAAEASGVIDYTYGNCQNANNVSCVEPQEINTGVPENCNITYAPVCGCNGMTYINECAADASGVTQFAPGVCNPVANQWQNRATPIYPGQLVCDATDLSDGNNISNYPGCTNVPLLGPEKVYVLHKTKPGDLQVLLRFANTAIDLDLFIISGMTNGLCLGQSIAPPGQNREEVIIENAPIGTYYIVVDGQFNDNVGNFCLQTSTGYLNTANAVEVQCGVPMATSNAPGENNIIRFSCGSGINTTNTSAIPSPGSGPEMVYTFTTNQDGQVSIDLFNLAADMNMYLVSELDRSSCIGFSTNAGTSTENISMNLEAGTYYVIVDGQMGATGDYMLNVSCPSACDMNTQILATNTDCNTASGTITIDANQGNNSFWYSIDGPISQTGGSADPSYQFTNLPSGMYEVYTLDMYGCMDREEVPVYAGLTNFMVNATVDVNQINLTMVGGAPPYQIFLNGNLVATTSNTTYTIPNLDEGDYEIEVVDATNCPQISMMQVAGLTVPTCNMTITAVPMGATCTGLGNISVDVYNGQAPFTATVNGTPTGQTYNATWFSIPSLAAGTYTVVITDANNCTATQTATVANNAGTVAFSANGTNASCGGGNGSVSVTITTGNSPFTATMNGAAAGTYTANNFTIPNVAPGTYTLEITDNWSCSSTATVTVGTGGSISINPTATNATCGSAGSISVGVAGGTGPYTATLDGNAAGTYATAPFTIPNVGAGTYNLVVTDANGCSDNASVIITNTGSNLTVTANPTSGSCSAPGSIAVNVTGGVGPYVVTLDGNTAGTYATAPFTIPNVGAGTYSLVVTDANSCTGTVSTTVGNTGGNITVTANPTSGSCSAPGSIAVDVTGGTAPFVVTLNGAAVGTYTNTWFTLNNIAPGTYTILVTDANSCTGTVSTTVGSTGGNITVTANPTSGSCSAPGSIAVDVTGGTAPFVVTLNGAVAGTYNNTWFTLTNVVPGTYTILVTDANGCTGTVSTTVGSSGGNITVTANPTSGSCNSPGSIAVDVTGGTAPYAVTLNGNAAGTYQNNWFNLQNVTPGTYTILVTDGNGCTGTTTVTVIGGGGFTVTATPSNGGCGTTASIAVSLNGGTAPFMVSMNGVVVGNTSQNPFTISNVTSGTYTLSVTDANGCTSSTPVTVTGGTNKKLIVSATTTGASCGSGGTIQLDILGGTPNFDVYLNGNLVTNTDNRWYLIQNVPAGTHTVRVVDANGCEHTITRTVTGTGGNITVTATQTVVACGSTGTVAVTVAGGSTPYTVFVNGSSIGTSNQTSFNIVNLSAGTYNVTIQGATGCSGSTSVTVSGSTKKFAVTGTVNSATGCSSPGSVQLDILGGVAPFDVYVDGNLVTNTTNRWYIIQNLAPGTYTIRVVDANGCEDTITKTVGGNSGGNISLTATTTNAGCNGGGTIALDINGGTAPFDVELDGTHVTTTSDRWFTITNVTAGSRTVKVTDANGCMATITKTVTGGGSITLATTTTGGTCSSNGSVQVDINGGVAPFDIELDGNFVATTSDSWYTIPNVAPGSHTIKVTDKNGCMSTRTIQVTYSNSSLFVGATSMPGNCSGGGKIMLDITGGTAPFDVELNGTFIVQTNDRWYTIQNVAAGGYDIKVTDANGCMGTHNEIVQNTGSGGVTIVANPTAATCSGNGSIAIDITAGDAPFDIELDGNFVATTMDNWYVISNVAAGDHTVKVTDKHGCMSSVSTTVGTSGSNLNLGGNVTAGTCSSNAILHLDWTGGTAPYDIEIDGNLVTTISDTWYDVTNLADGTYTVKITDKNGCSVTKTYTLTSSGSNITIDPDITASSCGTNNGQIKFSITGGTAPFDIFLAGNLEKDDVNARNHTFNSIAAGDYTIKVVDKNGCEEEITVTVGGSSNVAFTSTVVNAGCSGSKGSIEIDITSGLSPFEVFLDGGSVALINNRNYTFDNLDAGNYEVKVIDDNGCVLTEDLKITGGSSNLKMTATPTDASCDDDGTIAVDITGGDAPFEIYIDGNLETTTSDRWYTVTDLGPGIYMVRVVDANGCEDTSNEKIDGGSTLSATGAITNAACGQNGSIDITITGGDAPYEIYVDGNLETTTSDLTYAISNLTPATYAIRVVDANGCEVTFNRRVRGSGSNVSFTGTPTACGCGQTNGKIDVAITGGNAPYDVFVDGVLFGSTVSNDLTVTGLAPGNYDIRVVDADGCEDTNTVAVTQATGVSVTTTSTACGCNGITGTIAVDLTGGTAPYDIFLDGTYITSTTNSTYVIGGLAAGTYTVRAVDANDCEDSVTEDVLHFADLDFTITSTGAGCGMMNGSITVDITAGVAPFSIYSNGNLVATTNDNSYTIDNLPAGAYLIRVVDDNTCDDTQNVTITGSSSNISINATAFPENCGAMDGNIALDITGGVEPFDIYLDGVLITNTTDRWYNINDLLPGTYTVRVVDANGCEASQTVTVTGNSSINTSTSPTNSACSQMNGTITVDNSGGLAPYTIFLNGNDVGTTFNQLFTVAGLNPGTYDIRVEDANGCFAETQETVGGGGALSFTTSTTDESCGNPGQIAVDITAGTAPIQIFLDGNLLTTTSDISYVISGLTSASYDVRLIDASGCEETAKVTVGGSALLNFNVIAQPDNCGDNGSALVNITNGAAPFTIELDGVQVTTTNDRSYTITSLISGGYVVKVTDSQGCSDEIVVMINNTGQAPLAEFTFMYRPGGVVKFFSNNSVGNLSWDFDDGSTSTDANPIHTFTVGNSYKVCLTATNSCGTDVFCETLMVPTVYTSNLTFKTPPSNGREGEIIEVPVYVDNFDRVTSFQYSIKLGDKNRAHLLDIINDQLTDVEYELVDEETVTIKWESDDPNGVSRPDDFKIFDLRIQLNGARGECTPIEFVTNPMMIEVYQKWFADPTMVMPNFFNGEVCVSNMVNVAGNVHREDHKAVPNVEVTCNNSQSHMNDTQGDFQFEINSGNSCLILPVKDGDDYMALTILDLLAIRRHMTQATVFDSPYKIIAADMNRDQLVNGNDLGIVADLVLGNQTDMVHGDSWRFMPADWTFTDPTQPFSPLFPVMINLPIVDNDSYSNDFIGMKLGDVDYSLDMNTMNDKDYAMAGQLNFEVADRSVGANEEFVLEVKSSDFNNVCGFQFQLDFDPSAFEFVEMLPGSLVGLDHNMVGNAFAQNGSITMLWYDRALDPNGISTQTDEVAFRLKFKALQARNTIANQFNVGQSVLHDMGTDVFDNMLNINFGVEGQVSSTTNTNDVAFKLHQNYPNPFSKQTIIGFELPTPQDVQFELIDQSGRTVLSQNAFYPQGYQQIIVKGQDLPVSGVYFYRLRVADTIQTDKLIFMR